MSVSIAFDNVVKKYGNHTIIQGLSLTVNDGEFFTLLGPSGCGKTTLLRMVAGFNSIEGGTIAFNGTVINDIPPAKRNIGMVFQNYAVFPHMNVMQNVAFGLKNRHLPADEIRRRLDEILDIVHITEYAKRMPDRLSGGQQQRVALARAIVIHPNVLLMDEPLSNLDAKLRLEMRNAIRTLQNTMNITTIYVTHDQEEAMAVSDRIAVMNEGQIQQVGAPKAIYQRPSNLFVANFIGRSNTLPARLSFDGGTPFLTFENGTSIAYPYLRKGVTQPQPVKVSVRPEEFVVEKAADKQTQGVLTGDILYNVFIGLNTTYFIRLFNGEIIETVEESSIDSLLDRGTDVTLHFKLDKMNVFNEEGNENLTAGGDKDA